MKPSLSSSEVRALLHERLDALLSDCDKCNECGARYKVKTQYGEQQGETILLN